MLSIEALELFINSRLSKGLSPETVRWYKGILLHLAKECPELPTSEEEIEQFLAKCNSGDERRHGYYRTLSCFYRFLHKRLKIPNIIETIDPPRRSAKQPRFLTPKDVNQILVSSLSPGMKAAILFLIDTGARLGELASLDIDSLEDTPWGFTARVRGKTGERIIPICYETYHALMVAPPIDCKPHWLGILITRAFQNAGIKGTAHTLRHTFGTLWGGDELVLQRIMGHSHLSTTKMYRHLRLETMIHQHNQFSPLKMVLSSSKSML